MGADIPAEIWLQIADFLPDHQLFAVNSFLFHVVMKAKYKNVHLKNVEPTNLRLVKRLLDPFVGGLIKGLHLRLQHVKDIVRHPDPERSIRNRITDALSKLPAPSRFKKGAPEVHDHSTYPFDEFIKGLIAAFPLMTNLEMFCIDSWDVLPTYDLRPFWAAAWSSFGPHLRRLSLGGNLDGYRIFIESNPPTASLKELAMEFTNSVIRLDDAAELERAILQHVVPFINRLAPQLEFLKLWSWASVELSSLFANLDPFPSLHTFSIRTAFNKSFASDPSGLTNMLLQSASTLQQLELRLNPTGAAIDPTPERLLSEWLSTLMSDEKRPSSLQTLQIYPTPTAVGFDALLSGIRANSGSLTTLGVRDRYLQLHEIQQLVEALGSQPVLTGLRLNVWRLTAEVVDFLALKLPHLRVLSLYVGDTPLNEPAMEVFHADMEKRSYPNWKLYDIGVWQGGFGMGEGTMSLLARCIPTVRSFWGTGEMDPDSHCLS
ncbi:hypothetical protein BDN72DRAFT_839267 [Pluteus cervinus]|uniref:Uncharacterized protein n=1 Tax=Pluteus cervinus TaxID=181527 RepID=A0ACD3AX68_9AGAR|nr:hypothetical protein BDN72DRAFT_839267 [Pluteus cervinus]